MLPVLLGCVGGVCALSNVLGKETCELYALAKQGHFEEAKTLQQKLIPPNTAVSLYSLISFFAPNSLRENGSTWIILRLSVRRSICHTLLVQYTLNKHFRVGSRSSLKNRSLPHNSLFTYSKLSRLSIQYAIYVKFEDDLCWLISWLRQAFFQPIRG